jgi:hypothetical protein
MVCGAISLIDTFKFLVGVGLSGGKCGACVISNQISNL